VYCSVDVDLSKELQALTRPILQTQVEAARRGRAIGAEVIFLSFFPSSLLKFKRPLQFILDYVLAPGSSFTSLVIGIGM
jgi:hypothetical protein